MFISKMKLSSRSMLRGMGATLSLPLLEAMVPALSAAPKPITRFWFLADGPGIRVLTDTGFCLAGAATGADCLTCFGYAMTTGCSCSQSRGLGVGEGVGDGVGTGAGAIAWYLAIKLTTLLAQLAAPEVPTYG